VVLRRSTKGTTTFQDEAVVFRNLSDRRRHPRLHANCGQIAVHANGPGFAESQNGNSGYYIPVQGTALNKLKLKAFAGGGTEITASAYPASVITDVVLLSITLRKSL